MAVNPNSLQTINGFNQQPGRDPKLNYVVQISDKYTDWNTFINNWRQALIGNHPVWPQYQNQLRNPINIRWHTIYNYVTPSSMGSGPLRLSGRVWATTGGPALIYLYKLQLGLGGCS